MKPYPKYKPTNFEWIGEIPKHWEVKRLKYVALAQPSNVDKKSYEDELPVSLCNYVDVYKNDYIDDSISFMQATATQNEIEKFKLKIGDVIITKDSETREEIAIPALVKYECDDLICGYHLTQIRADNVSLIGDYVFRLFQTKEINANFESSANGVTRYALGSETINGVYVLLPPVDEQTTIANFLDSKTKLIDDSVKKKQELIELLKEERTAAIDNAITKGINSKAAMKPSGMEWLGEVPKHWEVKRLKYVVDGKLEYGANESSEIADRTLPRYIRITDFGEDGFLRDEKFLSLPMEIAKDYLLEEGDILFARSGATVGKTFQFKNYNGIACFAGYLIRARPNREKIISDYLYYFTRSGSYEQWKNSIFNQATIQNIGADKYNNLLVPIPSIPEQTEIVSFIETTNAKIDNTISILEKEIELLHEYRIALISEVVTGKVDVRAEEN